MLQDLLDENIKWVDKQKALDAEYFEKLSKGQEPEIMLVGCCDSRFPFEVITNSIPGDIFVHRNIANQVNPIDEDVISSIEFAVKVLEVKHIVVCGHYECGGVKAGMEHVDLPHVNSHIDSVKELFDKTISTHSWKGTRSKQWINKKLECQRLFLILNIMYLDYCIKGIDWSVSGC